MGSTGANRAQSVSDALNLPEAKANFLMYLKYRKASSPTTIKTYDYILREFINMAGNVPASTICTQLIDQYAVSMQFRNYKPKTYRNKLVVVKSFVSYLYKHDLCSLRPESIELPKEQHTEANFLTESEVKKLLKVIKSTRDRAMVLTLVSSGLRVSELTNLHISDMYKRSLAVRNGKGGKPRVTFITPEAEREIKQYLKHTKRKEGYLFPNYDGDRISRTMVARLISRYAKQAGINKKVTTHTLRHTMATTMLKRGARVEDVQQILGHTNIKTTLIYLHFTNYDLQRSYNKVMVKH